MDPERFGYDADENIYFDRTVPVDCDGSILFEETTIDEVVSAYVAAASRIAELERELDEARGKVDRLRYWQNNIRANESKFVQKAIATADYLTDKWVAKRAARDGEGE